jgi:hypothetical protein
MSDKTIAQKLSARTGHKILLLNSPKGYETSIGDLPSGTAVITKPVEEADVIQVFVQSRKELERQLINLKMKIKPAVILWITYPKGTSKMKADINRDTIAAYASSVGFKPVAMFAVDGIWAALRLKVVSREQKQP